MHGCARTDFMRCLAQMAETSAGSPFRPFLCQRQGDGRATDRRLERDAALLAPGRHVLALQDTSGFHSEPARSGRRRLARFGKGDDGVMLHATAAVGTLQPDLPWPWSGGGEAWTRDAGASTSGSQNPTAGSTTPKWSERAAEATTAHRDRRSRGRHLCQARCAAGLHLITRVTHDRTLADGAASSPWPSLPRAQSPGLLPVAKSATARPRGAADPAFHSPQNTLASKRLLLQRFAESVPFSRRSGRSHRLADVEPIHWRLLTTHAY